MEEPESYERKQQWADLFWIPLLLKMLRDLARAQRDEHSQASLENRHAVFGAGPVR